MAPISCRSSICSLDIPQFGSFPQPKWEDGPRNKPNKLKERSVECLRSPKLELKLLLRTWALTPNEQEMVRNKSTPARSTRTCRENWAFPMRAKPTLHFEARYHIPSRPARCVHPLVVVEVYSPPWSLKTSWAIQSVRRVRWSPEGSFGSPFLWTLDQMDQAWRYFQQFGWYMVIPLALQLSKGG